MQKKGKDHPSFPPSRHNDQNKKSSHNEKKHSVEEKRNATQHEEKKHAKISTQSSHSLSQNTRGNSHLLRSNIRSSGIIKSQKQEIVVQRRLTVHETVTNVSEDIKAKIIKGYQSQNVTPTHKHPSESIIRQQTSQVSHSQKERFLNAEFQMNTVRMKHQAQKISDSRNLSKGTSVQPQFQNKHYQRFRVEDSKHSQFIKTKLATNVNETTNNTQQTALNNFVLGKRFPCGQQPVLRRNQSTNSSGSIRNSKLSMSTENINKQENMKINKHTSFNNFLYRKNFPNRQSNQCDQNTHLSQNIQCNKPAVTTTEIRIKQKNMSLHKQTSLNKTENKTDIPYRQNMDSLKNTSSESLAIPETKKNINHNAKNKIRKRKAKNVEKNSCLLNFNREVNIKNKTAFSKCVARGTINESEVLNVEKQTEGSSRVVWETEENSDEDDDASILSVASSIGSSEDDQSDYDVEMKHSDFAVVRSVSNSNKNEIDDILSKEKQRLDRYSLEEIEFKHKTATLISQRDESHIAVYWDVENCPIPKRKSAVDFVKKIRDTFYDNHTEEYFMVACDTRFMKPLVEKELSESLVTIIHVTSENKNAADKRLQMFLDRFAHKYKRTNSSIVLVSGDSDFAPKLNEMRYSYHIYISLIHNNQARKALKTASNKSILFEDFIKDLPDRDKDETQQPYLTVSNLPQNFSNKKIKKALSDLIVSIDGRIRNISGNTAGIAFSNKCAADKALKKLQGISIAGRKINVDYEERDYGEFSDSTEGDTAETGHFSTAFPQIKAKEKKAIMKKTTPVDKNVKPVNRENTVESGQTFSTVSQVQGKSSLHVCVDTRLDDTEYWQLYFKQLWGSKDISGTIVGNDNGIYFINFESLKKAQKAKKILQKQQEIDSSSPKLLNLITGDNVLEKENARKQQQDLRLKKVDKFLNIVKTKTDSALKSYEEKLSSLTKKIQTFQNSTDVEDELNLEEKKVIQLKLDELKEQKAVFSQITNKTCQKFEKLGKFSIEDSDVVFEDLIKDYGRECRSFMFGPAVYCKQNIIVKTVRKNQVVILCAETGSGKSTQITQYLWKEGFASDGLIICTQPRKSATISCAKQVSNQLGCAVGNIVGYQVDLNAKRNKSTQIMYVTDFTLLKLCVTNPDFKGISCIIIDEAHERSIYTDLLLGMIKKCLPKRPDLKIIVTSATINVSVFLNYFQLGNDALLQILGRTFPIEDMWYDHDVKLGWNYLEKTVNIAHDILKQEPPGDILAFLATPAETERAVELFEATFKSEKCKFKVITQCLHGKLDVQEQQKVFERTPNDVRKVVFSTNCAETSVTIPGIKYVIDCGMVKEARFDESKNINVLSIGFVNRSSAEQRRYHAGRTQRGKCFRLYSEGNYNKDMMEVMTPEILRVNLGETFLKLMELGIPNLMQFDFVQSPSLESMQSAMKQLVNLGAVNKINRIFTEIGKSMARLPLEPRLSHLVIRGIEKEVGYEAVIIAALATVSKNIFFLNENSKKEADAKKMRFCREESDFFTYFEIYKEWREVPKGKKSRWCVMNCVNARLMRVAHDLVNELILTLSKELNVNLKTMYSTDKASEKKIQEIIFKSFSENLCIFSGHRKIGYLTPSVVGELHIHPSSSLCYLGVHNPQFIVYDTVLETSKTFLINITPVSEEMIQQAIHLGAMRDNLNSFKRLTLNTYRISCLGEGIIKRGLIGKDGEKLQALEHKIKENTNNSLSAIDINVDKGEITVYLPACYQEQVEKIIRPIITETQSYFYQEEQEIFGISGIPMLGSVMGVGGEIRDVLLPGEYRDVEVKIDGNIALGTVIEELDKCGDICFIKEEPDGCIKITYGEVNSAMYAVSVFQDSEEFTVKGMPKFFNNDVVTPFYKVAISWIRRPCTGLAFISFEPSIDIQQILSLFSSKSIDYEGNILKISRSKTTQHDLCIQNLPKTANSQTLRKILEKFLINVKLKTVVIERKKSFESNAEEIEILKSDLTHLLLNYTLIDQLYIDLKTPISSQVMYKAVAYFGNSYDGQIAVNALRGRACFEEEYLELKPAIRTSLYCNLKAFTAVKEQIDAVLIFLNKSSGGNDFLNITAEVKNVETVVVTISSNNLPDTVTAHRAFEEILKGEKINYSGNFLLEKLFSDRNGLILKDIEEIFPQAYIHLNKYSKTLSVFGTPETCIGVSNKINTFLEDINKESSKEISLASKDYPKGLLKHLVQKYGYNLEELRVKTYLKVIEINVARHLITITGNERAFDEFQNIIDSVSKELDISAEIKANEDCPLCLGPLDQKYYRLECCGHAYCKACLIVHLKNPNFPILCCKKDCNEPFVVADIKRAVKEEKLLFNDLCISSLQNFVANNENVQHCPTPECSMLFRVTEYENRYECPSCRNSICTRCCVFYHYGMSCEICQCSNSDEYSLQEWLDADSENRKLCPSCSSPIERNGGSNEMACWNCKSYFCWLCEKEFPTGQDLCAHGCFCQNN